MVDLFWHNLRVNKTHTLRWSFAKKEPMKKKDYIYCSIILFILMGSFISINDIIDSQEQSCWNMLKEISNSPAEI